MCSQIWSGLGKWGTHPWTLLIAVGVKPNAIRFTPGHFELQSHSEITLRTEDKTFLGAYDCRAQPASATAAAAAAAASAAAAAAVSAGSDLWRRQLYSLAIHPSWIKIWDFTDFNLNLFCSREICFVFQTNMFEINRKSGPHYAANFVAGCLLPTFSHYPCQMVSDANCPAKHFPLTICFESHMRCLLWCAFDF